MSDVATLLFLPAMTGTEVSVQVSILDKKTRGDLVKLVIFIVVTSLATGVLVVLIGNITFQRSQRLQGGLLRRHRVWSRATTSASPASRSAASRRSRSSTATDALVSFNVAKSSIVTKSSTATIRYRNLVGQRYISLTQGVGNLDRDAGRRRPSRSSRTQPALDLTVLFNGFKPLFAALSPADINKLSAEVVQIFQGEGGNLNQLLHEHRVADQHPGRPRPGDRRDDRQPQLRARAPSPGATRSSAR